jgi:hypothetical protein
VPLHWQIKFLALSGTEKKAIHKSKENDVSQYGKSLLQTLPRLWRRLPPQELSAAIAATGPGLALFLLNLILLQQL